MSTARDTWRKQPFIANPVLRYGLYAAIAVYVVTTVATLLTTPPKATVRRFFVFLSSLY